MSTQQRTNYTKKFKADAVDMILIPDHVGKEVAANVGISLRAIVSGYGDGAIFTAIVGWSMGVSMIRKLVMDVLSMGFWRRKLGKGCIHHSDRGSQYCRDDFQQLLKQ
ncbi:MAG: hypothetical protein JKY87_08285 [Mariprofundus sp.]|nr:hypothetical protein [Mariprofundus sp.]